MSKTIVVSVLAGLLAGGLVAYLLRDASPDIGPMSPAELATNFSIIAARMGRTNTPSAALAPLEMSHRVRLAIGGLGLAADEDNGRLGDLVTAQLTGAPGFDLVERQSLRTILAELNLNWSGLARARDAVRTGKLLKAEWFLLGTEAKIKGTTSIVARVVDARTGVIRDAGIFSEMKPPQQLAEELAGFLRDARNNAAAARLHTYLAIGGLEDVGVNHRQGDFPGQLRAFLTTAYHDGGVTLLERDAVETLLTEVNLDLAGLTDDEGKKSAPAMLSAFWLVSGQYQSYEAGGLQVELNLEVQHIFGKAQRFSLRDAPGEILYRRSKETIDEAMRSDPGNPAPTRLSEIKVQRNTGKELANLEQLDLVYPNHYQTLDSQETARRRYNANEAIKAFETVLLLDRTNREAKIYLAACLRKQTVHRMDEAREYYREVLEEPVDDRWSEVAREALPVALMESDYATDANWLKMAETQSTRASIRDFYAQQLQSIESDLAIKSGGGPRAKSLAEQKLFADIAANFNLMQGGSGHGGGDFGMIDFADSFPDGQAAAGLRLAELYPQMKKQFPLLAPQLLEFVVTYQTGTNSPLIAELEQSLDWQTAHPDEVYQSKYFKCQSSLYNWSLDHGAYPLMLKFLERNQRLNGITNASQLGDPARITLGFALMYNQKWKAAMDIFGSYSNRPVMMDTDGPWGPGWTATLTSRWNDYCRRAFNLPPRRSPHEFDTGKPVLTLNTTAAFAATGDGAWLGQNGQLQQLGPDLKTNLTLTLPVEASKKITAICPVDGDIWVGTEDSGLIEVDKSSRKCRRYTVEDGLMMNRISGLSVAGGKLWIGYGYRAPLFGVDAQQAQNGGLGNLDLASRKFTSFTPSIAAHPDADQLNADRMTREQLDQPPRHAIEMLAAGPDDNVWFATLNDPLRCFHSRQNSWEGFAAIHGKILTADQNHLYVGRPWNNGRPTDRQPPGPLGVSILDAGSSRWRELGTFDWLPAGSVSTLTAEDGRLWVGGTGYIALVDPVKATVLATAYVSGAGVDRIQTGGGFLWMQVNRDFQGKDLYHIPLSALQ